MATYKRDPIKSARKSLLTGIRDDIDFMLERAAIEWDSTSDLVQPRPLKDLPLYSTGSHGEINRLLAIAYMAGEDSTSMRVYKGYEEFYNENVKKKGAPIVMEYTQGKLYIAGRTLQRIGTKKEKKIARVALEYASLESCNY